LGYNIHNSHTNDKIKNIISESINNREAAEFPIFNCGNIKDKEARPGNDYAKTIELLQPAINKIAKLFEEIAESGCTILSAHAPAFITANIKPIVYNVLPFSTMGWYGGAAVKNGALVKPGSDDIVSVCGYIG